MNDQDKVRWAAALRNKYGIAQVEQDVTLDEYEASFRDLLAEDLSD